MNHSEMDNGPIIVCRDIHVRYGGEDVLRNVNLSVPAGSFIPFIGPNGSGKSTLLRAILGLAPVWKGTITTPFHRSPPGYVPQQNVIDPLYPVSVAQVIRMGLYPQLGPWKRLRKEHHVQLRNLLERFGLTEHVHKRFHELSGGMRKKCLIARALISGAEVLVLDEPTSDLDEHSEQEILDLLSLLHRDERKTILMAYHGADRISKIASHVCVVDHGRIRVSGIS